MCVALHGVCAVTHTRAHTYTHAHIYAPLLGAGEVEAGWTCNGSAPCVPLCGDLIISADSNHQPLECEDGNDVPGDGCFNCKVEVRAAVHRSCH